jgi:hypothetical protein
LTGFGWSGGGATTGGEGEARWQNRQTSERGKARRATALVRVNSACAGRGCSTGARL